MKPAPQNRCQILLFRYTPVNMYNSSAVFNVSPFHSSTASRHTGHHCWILIFTLQQLRNIAPIYSASTCSSPKPQLDDLDLFIQENPYFIGTRRIRYAHVLCTCSSTTAAHARKKGNPWHKYSKFCTLYTCIVGDSCTVFTRMQFRRLYQNTFDFVTFCNERHK